MEYNSDFENQKQENAYDSGKTPTGLIALCILTFIGSGFSILAYLLYFFMYDILPDIMLSLSATMGSSLAEYYTEQAEIFRNTPQYFFLLITIPYLLSITGSGGMIRMRKWGFHLYIIGQILLLGLPMLQQQGFNFFGLLLSIVFIALYSSYLKKMK
jgi:hypothetical protein